MWNGGTGNESSHVKQTPERRKGLGEEKAISRKETRSGKKPIFSDLEDWNRW